MGSTNGGFLRRVVRRLTSDIEELDADDLSRRRRAFRGEAGLRLP